MKNNFWLIIASALVIALAIYFRPDSSKKLKELAKKELQKQELVYKKTIDSIQNLRKKELANHNDQLIMIDSELKKIQKRIYLQDQKIKSYEKELATYRSGNFDERYGVFSKTYNPQGNN